jgi:hypothetical protein
MSDEPAAYTGDRGLLAFSLSGTKRTIEQKFGGDRALFVGLHQPLIKAQDWIAAQERAKAMKVSKRRGRSLLTWLSGIATCGECGGQLSAHTSHSGPFLQCRIYTHRRTCTNRRCYATRPVEAAIEAEINAHVAALDLSGIQTEAPQRRTGDADIKLLEIEKKIGNLVDAIAESGAGEKHLAKRLDALEEERQKLLEQASANSVENHTQQRVSERLAAFLSGPGFPSLSLQGKREFASALISKLTISADNEINIEWFF